MIKIDGSIGEGGGQIIRTALALSMIYGVPVKICNIRAKRSNPGLRPQHLWVVKALKEISDARVSGARIGSTELVFEPGEIKYRDLEINIGTAGSITLLFQSLFIPLVFTDRELSVRATGGTDVKFAPTIDYFRNVFLRCMNEELGTDIAVEVIKRGFYPKGGGEVLLHIRPSCLKGFSLTRHEDVHEVHGISIVSGLPEDVLKRQTNAAKKYLIKHGLEYRIKNEHIPSENPGTSITLWTSSNYIGSQGIGEKGVRAEVIGENCARELVEEIQTECVVDKYLADQLVPYLLFVKGEYRTSKITEHTRTNVYVCNLFEEKIEINGVYVRS